jgi:hypothetical protein
MMKRIATCLLVALVVSGPAGAADATPEDWQPVARLIGTWSGTASGSAGEASVQRRYAFVVGGRYVHETNTATYPPQEKNKTGEVHEHWGIFSFDKQRRTLVLRQFHVESFVNTYRRVEPPAGASATLVFESESFEKFNNAWKARESAEFLFDDDLVEVFELAPPGQPWRFYSRAQLRRTSR